MGFEVPDGNPCARNESDAEDERADETANEGQVKSRRFRKSAVASINFVVALRSLSGS